MPIFPNKLLNPPTIWVTSSYVVYSVLVCETNYEKMQPTQGKYFVKVEI